jgi:iron complex outermembrane receptor protein
MRIFLQVAARSRTTRFFTLAAVSATAALLVTPHALHAQANTGTVVVRVTADSIPVSGATIAAAGTSASRSTDRSGLAYFTLPTGRRSLRVTSNGFRPESLAVNVGAGRTNVSVALRPQVSLPVRVTSAALRPEASALNVAAPKVSAAPRRAATLPEGIVAVRRDAGKGRAEPTNVESTDRADLEDQIDRSPASMAELPTRIDGVRMQSLSAGSGGAALRIRGMPGRYTKVLMDGLPLLGATPEGQDLLQLPVLDVQRVEVIKGVSSALYGPTAFGGVVNVVSAAPTSRSQIVVNGSTHEASDVAIWQTHTFTPRWSASLLAGRHYQNPSDGDGDGWDDVNAYKRVVIRPRVYWARSDRSTWYMTGGWTSEVRESGTFEGARLPDYRFYDDNNNSRRADAGTVGRISLDTNMYLTIRASMTREWRTRWFGDDRERNRRNMIFSDIALTKSIFGHTLVGGVALERDQYYALDERRQSYRFTTPALYGEHEWSPLPWLSMSSNVRLDLHSEYGDFVSPRVALVARPTDKFTARLSAASGAYAPTPLTDETEGYGLSHVRPTSREAEHATGWSLDLSHLDGEVEWRGSLYRTVINHPLILRTAPNSQEQLQLVNTDEPSITQGADVSLRYRTRPLRFTATYSFIDATRPEIGQLFGEDFEVDTVMRRVTPLNPKHSARFDLANERENNRVVGVTVNFVGVQALSDTLYSASRAYVTLDARIEKNIRSVVLFAYGHNLTGVRQSQFFPVLLSASGSGGQWTRDAWAPLDGISLNAGLRIRY